ncbi:SusD/RagB family nutrient-binding outer membrane lipoprotein [Abyssalbus ytuae]|uniref:SusD/RagB family nutrient-binding outer membrane lipoprotein n=1 Tax=Abyssalbus ytuae TaxID=2926907 RepID=A0A9E7A001_9FLAO|nr:SusD/RagB family nutrient-binding outer membrane lipoprotein [Abyssalbus ytuae]UOB18277.1 SusD/RagB family nutrient-binding outer membrane lipoprotein [Abyssalbus ytuae]
MRYIKLIVFTTLYLLVVSCTEDFDELNTDQQGFTEEEVSAKFFLTSVQYLLYSPDRYPYWRAHLIHADRFAGHFCFGHNASWWSDGLGYTYDAGYTDAAYDWLAGYFGKVKSFQELTAVGGEYENQYMYAMALIIKGLYYQMYTDTFGMVPFTEAGVEGILTPVYDEQKVIYEGIIADLDEAVNIIGDAENTGIGIEEVRENDLYCGGDLQKWKRLANTLKLRIGMRALGAEGDDFAMDAITSALSSPLLDDSERYGSVVMEKDFVISQWTAAAYGDIWYNFGAGSDWTMGSTLINILKDNNDPRLGVYAQPAIGGEFIFEDDGTDDNYQARLDFIIASLDEGGADYTLTTEGTKTTIELPGEQYIGQPTRLNGDIYPYVRYNLFSTPSEKVIQDKGAKTPGYDEIVLTSAESYFLQAEAVVRGIISGDAQALFAKGITEAMKLWDISVGEAAKYIENEAIADISAGTTEEKLEKIALQRWLVSYTDGFEAWAIVRDTGYPSNLAAGVSDPVLFELGTLNGAYPQRMRYGSNAQANPNYSTAISTQGPDVQGTKLWFAK